MRPQRHLSCLRGLGQSYDTRLSQASACVRRICVPLPILFGGGRCDRAWFSEAFETLTLPCSQTTELRLCVTVRGGTSPKGHSPPCQSKASLLKNRTIHIHVIQKRSKRLREKNRTGYKINCIFKLY